MPPKHNSNNMAAASLICGIAGVIFSIIPMVGLWTWILCVLAIVFALIGKKKFEETGDGKGMMMGGLITGIVGAVFTLVQVACVVIPIIIATSANK